MAAAQLAVTCVCMGVSRGLLAAAAAAADNRNGLVQTIAAVQHAAAYSCVARTFALLAVPPSAEAHSSHALARWASAAGTWWPQVAWLGFWRVAVKISDAETALCSRLQVLHATGICMDG